MEPVQIGKFNAVLAGVGMAAGLGYAIKTKSGFWKGAGWVILFSVIGGAIGYGVDQFSNKDK
jgi:hypothetical protein